MSGDPTIPIGTIFRERYKIESVLGQGGFGNTYVALDQERFNRKCVLKELLPKHKGDARAQELFEREARSLDRLDHPGIPRLEAFFVYQDRYYLVEAFVDGKNLFQILEQRGALPEAEVTKIATETLAILDYLHRMDPPVIHRDLKPMNLMMTTDGHCKLIDFGAVREAISSTSVSDGSTIIGTPGYMAPEQHRGQAFPASDLYALGATLLHLLTGRPPTFWYDSHQGAWTFEGKTNASPLMIRVLKNLLQERIPERYDSARTVLKEISVSADPRQKLITLVDREGYQLIHDTARCENLLNQEIGGEHGHALLLALKANVPQALLKAGAGTDTDAFIGSPPNGLSTELAQWAVQAWRSALDNAVGKTQPLPKPVPKKLPWKIVAGAGVAAAGMLWWALTPKQLKLDSVQFFGNCKLASIPAGTAPRSNYKQSFLNNEVQYICYDFRLAEPAPSDAIIDVSWQEPDGSKKPSTLAIKKGTLGETNGWGFREAGKLWAVGRYKVEFARGSEKLTVAEFEVKPAPIAKPWNQDPFKFPRSNTVFEDILKNSPASPVVTVVGPMRFFEGPREVPAVPSRVYRNRFGASGSRFIRSELTIKNSGTGSGTFKVQFKWYNLTRKILIADFSVDFTAPKVNEELVYSGYNGNETPGYWTPGKYGVDAYIGGKKVSAADFEVE